VCCVEFANQRMPVEGFVLVPINDESTIEVTAAAAATSGASTSTTRRRLDLGSSLCFAVPDSALQSAAVVCVYLLSDLERCVARVSVPLANVPLVQCGMPFGPTRQLAWKPSSHYHKWKGSMAVAAKLYLVQCTRSCVGSWSGRSAGGDVEHATWLNSPQYFVRLGSQAIVSVALQSRVGRTNSLLFYVLRIDSSGGAGADDAPAPALQRLDRAAIRRHVGAHSVCANLPRCELAECELDLVAGLYCIVVCAKSAGVEGTFTLSLTAPINVAVHIGQVDADNNVHFRVSAAAVAAAAGTSSASLASAGCAPMASSTTTLSMMALRSHNHGGGGDGDESARTFTEKSLDEFSERSFVGDDAADDGSSFGGTDIHQPLLVATDAIEAGRLEDASKSRSGAEFAAQLLQRRIADAATPLMRACIACESERLAALLAEPASAELVDEKDSNGSTALMHAVVNDCAACVKLLVEAGASIDAKDQSGTTALMKAAVRNRTKCCRILIKSGADVRQTDCRGETAAYKAALLGKINTQSVFASEHRGRGAIRNLFMVPKQAAYDWDYVQLLLAPRAQLAPPPSLGAAAQLCAHGIAPPPSSVLDILLISTCGANADDVALLQVCSVNGDIVNVSLLIGMSKPTEVHSDVVETIAEGQVEILRVLSARNDGLMRHYANICKMICVSPMFYDVVPLADVRDLFSTSSSSSSASPSSAAAPQDMAAASSSSSSSGASGQSGASSSGAAAAAAAAHWTALHLPLFAQVHKLSFLLRGVSGVQQTFVRCHHKPHLARIGYRQLRGVITHVRKLRSARALPSADSSPLMKQMLRASNRRQSKKKKKKRSTSVKK
jgi:Ankyrin repeats (3 copies)/Ankyrin repeat